MSRSTLIKIFFTLIILIGLSDNPLLAGKKKKKKAPPGQKVSLFKRAYEDVTTRNNYYFNANLQWKETVANVTKNRKIDYDSILPIYFHDKAALSSYNAEWDNIIKKVGLVMQMHDYTRWKDNAYLLLGEAHYMKGEYDKALQTFKYISTTMKGPIGREKLSVTNKERLQIMKEMEKKRKKESKEKQKLIEFKIDLAKKEAEEKQEVAEEKAETAKKEAQKKADEKQKILKEKIKLKEKYLDLKARGKSVEPTFSEYYQKNSKYYTPTDTLAQKQPSENKADTKPTATTPPDYSKLRIRANDDDTTKLAAENRTDDSPLADSLNNKMDKKASDLSLWEKIKHKPSRPDAVVWLSKVLIKEDEGEIAHALIQYGQAMKKLTRKNKRDLQLIEAYYYIQRKNYELAQLPMENAIELTRKKNNKAWYLYILAQMQEYSNQYPAALINYKKARKYSSNYEMSFYSNMSMARLYGLQGMESSENEITSRLRKLVRGGKNKEFADQVYYSLAQIALKNNDTTAAIEYLHKSINEKLTASKQNGLSYALLSSIAFEQNHFQEAVNNAESAVGHLPADLSLAEKLNQELPYLRGVAEEAEFINKQDSLLILASMTEAELNSYLSSKLMEELATGKKKKRKNNWAEGIASSNSPLANTDNGLPTPSTDGKWYFYNPELLSQGYNQFISIWGTRPLLDGWRRSQKSTLTEFNAGGNPVTNPELSPVMNNPEEEPAATEQSENIVMKIPRTPKDIEDTKNSIAESLYNLGVYLRAGLSRPDKSLPYFNRLLSDFPTTELTPQTHYNLYLAYASLDDIANAEIHKSALLTNNPNSIFSTTITNPPNYTLTKEKPIPASGNDDIYYASTYSMYNEGKYNEVISRKNYAIENYSGSKLIPQFEFLSAMSQGYLQNIPALKNELSQIILKYPDSEVQKKAQEYLRYITKLTDSPSANAGNEPVTLNISDREPLTGAPQTPYQTGDDNLYFMAYFEMKDNMLETYKQRLTFVGDENFGKDKYRTSNAFLDSEKTVLLAKRFKSEQEAGKYLDVIKKNYADIFGSAKVELFIISQSNFRTFFDTKDISAYRTFYEYYFK